MGKYMDKMLAEMKAAERKMSRQVPPECELLSDEAGRKYQLIKKTCPDCGAECESRIYYFPGYVYQTNRLGRCPACREKQERLLEADEKDKIRAENNELREKWRYSCGIPRKFWHKGFQHYEQDWQPKAYARCFEYAENFPITNPQNYESLVLYSDHSWGTGKTHLAAAIAHHVLNRWNGEPRRCPVAFISEPMLFKMIRDTYSYNRQERETQMSEKQIIDSLVNTPLLILDDLGKEEVSDPRFVQRTLFAIFDGRYNLELPVVITANLNDSGLRRHMGGGSDNEAAFNRLNEMCRGTMVCMDGKSYREKIAQDMCK